MFLCIGAFKSLCLPSVISRRFVGGLPEKLAKRLTGHGLCHDGNTTLGSRLPLYRLILLSLLSVNCLAETRVRRLYRFGDLVKGQPVSASLQQVIRRRRARHNSPVQQSPLTSPASIQAQSSTSSPVRDHLPIPMAQYPAVSMEDLIHHLQQTVETMQQDAARQAEVTARQAEVINRLQQQPPQPAAASASHAPPMGIPTPIDTAHAENHGNPVESIPPQASKAPVYQTEALFEFEVDPTVLKFNKLEKHFKRAQGVNSIPDIEDGYTNSAVTLPDRFKMLHIDKFDGFGDPMVHLWLCLDILRPMGLTRLQKLSLFNWTLSSIAAIWYAKLEDSVKQSWEEMAEAFYCTVLVQYTNRGHNS
ncbi:hypothetical protein ACSBR2_012174 [Camellia fascicularis]